MSVVRGGALGRENSLHDYACGLQTEKEKERERESERVGRPLFPQLVRDTESTYKTET